MYMPSRQGAPNGPIQPFFFGHLPPANQIPSRGGGLTLLHPSRRLLLLGPPAPPEDAHTPPKKSPHLPARQPAILFNIHWALGVGHWALEYWTVVANKRTSLSPSPPHFVVFLLRSIASWRSSFSLSPFLKKCLQLDVHFPHPHPHPSRDCGATLDELQVPSPSLAPSLLLCEHDSTRSAVSVWQGLKGPRRTSLPSNPAPESGLSRHASR